MSRDDAAASPRAGQLVANPDAPRRLPMTEVAAAAGFGSIRRFNEIFQQLYRRPPTALRRRGLADQSVCATGAVSVKLGFRPPYDWEAILSFLRARAIPGIEAVSSSRYVRTIAIADQHGMLVVEPAERNCLKATVRFPALRHLPAIIARVRRVFDLAADPTAIGADLSQDPLLAPLVAARPGLRVPGAWDGFRTRRARHSRAADHRVGGDAAGRQIGCVPWRERRRSCRTRSWADAGISHASATRRRRLAAIGMPQASRTALSSLAAAVVADPLIFGPRRSLEAAIEQLRSLPGVGEWTAQYIAMRELREPDAFPAADIGLMRAMGRGNGARPSPAELLAHAERWRPWRAYAALHLWAAEPHASPAVKEVPHEQQAA